MKQRWFEATIGLCFLGILTVLWIRYGNMVSLSQKQHIYQAQFAYADGLAVGTEVHIRGVRIGSIVSMRLTDDFQALVSFSLPSDMFLSIDTQVKIEGSSLLGPKILVLEPGLDSQILKPGDILFKTTPPLKLEALLLKILPAFLTGSSEKSESLTS